METDTMVKRLETSLEFMTKELEDLTESLGYRMFIEGQIYAYKSVLEGIHKERIERVWQL